VHATTAFTGDGRIESWAKKQKDKPSRSEAIRRLIEFALAVKAKGQNTHDE
jgi:metal-responsive CopG/Arc/MetJ family transcriptional regulator